MDYEQCPSDPTMQLQGTVLDYPGGAASSVLVWFFGWWALWQLLRCQTLAPYLLALSLAAHLRIKPPLGQVVPIADPVAGIIWPWSRGIFMLLAVATVASLLQGRSTWPWYLGASVACLIAVVRRWRYDGAKAVRDAFEAIENRGPSGSSTCNLPVPRHPSITNLHAYTSRFFSTFDGSSSDRCVSVKRLQPEGCPATLDVWLQDGAPCAGMPIFFYVHGGGWKGGGLRANPHGHLMQILASWGFFVVSAEYRRRWPQQLDDVLKAFEWLQGPQAAEMGADVSRLTVGGASAGGHIVSLLVLRALQQAIPIRGAALFYPAVDPGDLGGHTARSPLTLWPIFLRRGQSLMAWFFEMVILERDSSKWRSATILSELHPEAKVASEWPPTLILHGSLDSVVPLESSFHFLSLLAAADQQQSQTGSGSAAGHSSVRRCDAIVTIPGGRHTFDLMGWDEKAAAHVGTAHWLLARVAD